MRYVHNYKCCSRNLSSIGKDLWQFVRRGLERGSVLISFFVPGADWYPSHDILPVRIYLQPLAHFSRRLVRVQA